MKEPKKIVENLLFKDECFQIVGICIKIHNSLGKGFKEIVYKDAMEAEFKKNAIPYAREKRFNIDYEGTVLPRRFDADFFVYDSIIIEVKSSRTIHPDNFKQTLNYLKVSKVKLGILINFGEDRLNFKRIVCTY